MFLGYRLADELAQRDPALGLLRLGAAKNGIGNLQRGFYGRSCHIYERQSTGQTRTYRCALVRKKAYQPDSHLSPVAPGQQ